MTAPTGAGLTVKLTANYQGLSKAAGELIIRELRKKPDLLLCVSAGGSPRGTYAVLTRHYQQQPRLFRKVRILQIDEWGGLDAGGPGTCLADLDETLLKPLNIPRSRCHLFHTETKSPQKECERAAKWLEAHGPIDLCILGLGLNGHVAMNEPAREFKPRPHVAKLAQSSSHHPMLKGLRRKPRFGLTLGLADILGSRKVLLLVSGPHKRAILKKVLRPKVTSQLPASFLWLHPDTMVFCDHAAFGKSSLR